MPAMNPDKLQHLVRQLRYSSNTPPRDVLWAVASLLDVENAETDPALLSWSIADEGTTSWYVFGLTSDLVMTVFASADRVPWTYSSDADGQGHKAPDGLEASVRPRSSVSRLDVTAFQDTNAWADAIPSEWRTSWRIHFDDGKTFDLPADQWLKTDEAARELLADLRGR